MESALRSIVRSVKFELPEAGSSVRLLGPDMSYHAVDPYLAKVLPSFKENMGLDDILFFKSQGTLYDLCFEDSWSGYFIAEQLCKLGSEKDLVLIHLDDHMDMMPTLLVRSEEGLTDPATGRLFDPAASKDWDTAISSGCVSIGNFITPLYYSGHNIHVRHLNNTNDSSYQLRDVKRQSVCYELIPNKQFAAICKTDSECRDKVGSYLEGSSPEQVLKSIPQGCVIIHIDLDYFINDFNGNPRTGNYVPDPDMVITARHKINQFFDTLCRLAPLVDRWIIATSPGFCSAYHWHWLLAEIEENIERFESA